MPSADIVTRPNRFTWDAYPNQVRTLEFDGSGASPFPDGYLTGRTYELRFRGVADPYDGIIDTDAKTITFPDVQVPGSNGPVRVLLVDTTTATDDVIARGVCQISESGGTPESTATITVTTTDEVTFDLAVTVLSPVIEGVQDIVGAMFTGNTETGIAATYDDVTGKVNLVAEVTQVELDTEATARAAADTALDGRLDTAETTLSGLGSVATLDTGTAAGEVRTNSQNDGTYVAKAGSTMTGELVVPSVSLTGVTGAAEGGRVVGFTDSGPPLTGTHEVNDLVFDVGNQAWWVCSVAGEPGTWDLATGVLSSLVTIVATEDQALPSATATLTDDSVLRVPMQANEQWKFRAGLFLLGGAAAATADAQLAVTVPAGATINAQIEGPVTTASANTSVGRASLGVAASGTAKTVGMLNSGQVLATVEGFVTNGDNAGYLQIQFAQSVSTADVLTRKAGSFLDARRTSPF